MNEAETDQWGLWARERPAMCPASSHSERQGLEFCLFPSAGRALRMKIKLSKTVWQPQLTDSGTWKTDLPIHRYYSLAQNPMAFILLTGKAESFLEGLIDPSLMSFYLPPLSLLQLKRPFHSLPPPSGVVVHNLQVSAPNVFYPWALLGALRWKHRATIPVLPILLFPTALATPDTLFLTLFCRFSVSHPQPLPHEWVPLGQGLFAVLLTAILPVPGIVPDIIGDQKILFEWMTRFSQRHERGSTFSVRNEDVTSVEKNFRYSQY